MKRKHKRLTFVVIAGLFIALAVGLMLSAFEENIVFFRTPGDVASGSIEEDRRIRLGGLVEEGSVVPGADGLVNFSITDTVDTVQVTYVGILPDLFREGQGVITEGKLMNGVFVADEVLAKHDENYMPPEVSDAIKEAGQWYEDGEHGSGDQ
ncbi:MAG: cytochrome c maturation protein CcmE [Rhodospirillales bacterium]|nr:cytochrome c maturation protein CcmE [Rhodospirillales bacterium]MBT4041787.1 cytochrome c maturation protein CcmE [Rhodospirillales bacterium]MBT4628483.1 cytochrome c maturation protein CcmE [Rhodospirillales bacterium]MBT5351087.1 cytochrome c maturation protein CcmE [Rhodospirillales bacterium]MBT5520733.1 cytochrome c maturation protein CcmE [Rhodospirillales bacterium]